MGYRMNDIPKDIPQRVFDVRNGATLKVAFACYYYIDHDTKLHDHLGWPNPDSPDNICQQVIEPAPWIPKHIQVEPRSLEPIHLVEEGYDSIVVEIEDEEIAEVSTINASIDTEEDHVIRINITVNLPTFSDKPKTTGITVFAVKGSSGIRDAVCHGLMKVLPGSKFNS